jgi:hypothetical protein
LPTSMITPIPNNLKSKIRNLFRTARGPERPGALG